MCEDPKRDSSICRLQFADVIGNQSANAQSAEGNVRQRGVLDRNDKPFWRLARTSVVGWFTPLAMICISTGVLAGIGNAQGGPSQPIQEVAMLRYLHGINLAKQALDAGDPWLAEKHLQALDPKLRSWEWNVLARQARAELKFLTWDYSQGVTYGQNRFLDVTFLPGLSKVATRREIPGGNELCIWDIESGKLTSQVSCQETPLLDISGDGRLCAMATDRSLSRATIRDIDSGEVRSVIPELGGSISHLRFSPNGKWIAVVIQANTGGAFICWDLEGGKVLWQSQDPVSITPFIAFANDGNRIATASPMSGRIAVWDASTGERIQEVESSPELRALLFHPKQDTLIWSDKEHISMVDLKSGHLTKRLSFGTPGTIQDGNEQSAKTVDKDSVPETTMIARAVPKNVLLRIQEIDSIAICPQGRYLAVAYGVFGDERGTNTGKGHGTVRLVDLETDQELVLLRGEIGVGPSGASHDSIFSFDANGRHLAWCGRDGVSILNLDQINFGANVRGSGEAAISPDGKVIATSDGVVQLGTERRIGKRIGGAYLQPPAAFSRDGSRVAGGRQGGSWNVPIWNSNTGEKLVSLDNSHGAPTSIAFSPDDRWVMLVTGIVSICDATTGESVAQLQRGDAEFICGAFSPTEKLCVTGGSTRIEGRIGGEVVVWDVATWKPKMVLQDLDRPATSVAWSPDGKWIAACSGARSLNDFSPRMDALHEVLVWDAKTGKERFRLKGHADEVNAVLFTPDSQRLLSASSDATIKVWDLQLGLEVMTLSVGSDPWITLSLSKDGSTLAAGSVLRSGGHSGNERLIYIWSAKPMVSAPEGRHHPLLEKQPGRHYEPPPSLDVLYDLAREHAEAGRSSEALITYVETLRHVRAELSSDQIDWLNWIEKLGDAFSSLNEFEQSIDLMEKALKQREATQGRGHPDTQSVAFRLGIAFEKSGQYDKAIPLLEEVYETSKKDTKVFFNHQFLANAYAKTGRIEDSMRIVEEELEKFRGYYPAGSPEIASRLAFYGNMLSESGAFKESATLLRECLQIRETTQPNAWTIYSARSLLGGALLGAARSEANAEEKAKLLAEAESLLVSGYEGLKERAATIPAQGTIRISQALERVIDLLTVQGRFDEAEQFRHKNHEENP